MDLFIGTRFFLILVGLSLTRITSESFHFLNDNYLISYKTTDGSDWKWQISTSDYKWRYEWLRVKLQVDKGQAGSEKKYF